MNLKQLVLYPVKIKHDADDIFLWSDFHNGHNPNWNKPLWALRGFGSVEEHDEVLTSRYNAKARPTSIFIHLGDIMFGEGGAERLEKLLDKLNFSVMFAMPGNHTAGFRQLFEKTEGNVYYIGNKKIIFCPNYMEFFINSASLVACHYPICSWNGMGGGSIHVYGHVHGNLVEPPKGKAVCIDIESQPNPLSFKELQEKANAISFVKVDGHGPKTQNPF